MLIWLIPVLSVLVMLANILQQARSIHYAGGPVVAQGQRKIIILPACQPPHVAQSFIVTSKTYTTPDRLLTIFSLPKTRELSWIQTLVLTLWLIAMRPPDVECVMSICRSQSVSSVQVSCPR